MARSTTFSELGTRLNNSTFIEAASIANALTALENTLSDEEQLSKANNLRNTLREVLERYRFQNIVHDLIFDIQIFLARYWSLNNRNNEGEIEDFFTFEVIEVEALDGDNVIPFASGHILLRTTVQKFYDSEHGYVSINRETPKHPIYPDVALSERDQRHLLSNHISLQIPPQRPLPSPELRAMNSLGTGEIIGKRIGFFLAIPLYVAIIAIFAVGIPAWILLPISLGGGAIYLWRDLIFNREDSLPFPLGPFNYGFLMSCIGSIMGTCLASLIVTGIMAVLTACAGIAAMAGISATLTAALPFTPLVLFASLSIAECFRNNAMVDFFAATLKAPFWFSIGVCRYIGKGLDKALNHYRQYRSHRQPPASPDLGQIQRGLGISESEHNNEIPIEAANPNTDILLPWRLPIPPVLIPGMDR